MVFKKVENIFFVFFFGKIAFSAVDAGVNLPDDVDYNNEEQQSQLDDNPETHQTSSMNQLDILLASKCFCFDP